MNTPNSFRVMSMAAALVAAVVFGPNATAARVSLADRVAKLETQAQTAAADKATAGQANIETLNRLNQLQSEIQSLRGLIEQQKFQIEELQKRNRDQYLDLDGRLNRLEGGVSPSQNSAQNPAQNPVTPSAPTAPVNPTPSAPVATPSATPPVNTPSNVATGNTNVPPTSSDPTLATPGGEQADYDKAFAALRDGRYADSARLFDAFLQAWPESALAPNASYWLGESYYVTQNYDIALETFQNLLRDFGESSKAPDALLKLGYCQYELGQVALAERTLMDVIERFPGTTIAGLAEGRLRSMRFDPR